MNDYMRTHINAPTHHTPPPHHSGEYSHETVALPQTELSTIHQWFAPHIHSALPIVTTPLLVSGTGSDDSIE